MSASKLLLILLGAALFGLCYAFIVTRIIIRRRLKRRQEEAQKKSPP